MIFLKAQISAFLGGVIDYLVMLYCVEILHIHYIPAIAIGGLVGAVVNYSIGRNWAFRSKSEGITTQFSKYAIVSLGSIILKSSGTFILTETIKIDYRLTRLMIDAIVAFGFNFTLQKYWVFKPNQQNTTNKAAS